MNSHSIPAKTGTRLALKMAHGLKTETAKIVRIGATGTSAPSSPTSPLKYLLEGMFMTVEKIDTGGSLQARRLARGSVQFYWRYSHEGRTHRESIGHYDPHSPPKKREPSAAGFSVTAARERCRALAIQHGQRRLTGGLPEVKVEERAAFKARKVAQVDRSTRTLRNLLETYLAHLEAQGRRSHVDAAGIFKAHVFGAWPELSERTAVDLTSEDVLDMQRRLVEQGKGRTANKLRSYLRAAYQCAIDVRMSAAIPVHFKAFGVHINPAAQTKRDASFDRADKRPLSVEELKAYWRLVRGLPGLRGSVLRLHLLTGGQRVLQLLRLRWADTTASSITIFDAKGRPGQGARRHVVPLLPKASAVLREFERGGEYVISSMQGVRPVEAATVTGWARDAASEAIEGFQLKRVRSGIETLLAANGVSREVRGHLQSHGLTGVQHRHYDGHDYMPEKQGALELLLAALEQRKRRQPRPGSPTR